LRYGSTQSRRDRETWRLVRASSLGWKKYGVDVWKKGEQFLGVTFNRKTGDYDVLWGNEYTSDVDVLGTFDDQREAIKYAEKWIVDRETS